MCMFYSIKEIAKKEIHAMDKPIRILGIAGSLRRKSYNRAALRAAQRASARRTRSRNLSSSTAFRFLSRMTNGTPPAKVVELKKRIREADAVLFVTPEYNYSIPGRLEERDRLGLAALRRQRLDGQTGGDHGRLGGTVWDGAGAIPFAAGLRVSEYFAGQSAGSHDRQRGRTFRRRRKSYERGRRRN